MSRFRIPTDAPNTHEYILRLANTIEMYPPEAIFGFRNTIVTSLPLLLRKFAHANKEALLNQRAQVRFTAFKGYPYAEDLIQGLAFVSTFMRDRIDESESRLLQDSLAHLSEELS